MQNIAHLGARVAFLLPKRSHSPFVIKLLISPPASSCNWTSSYKWKMKEGNDKQQLLIMISFFAFRCSLSVRVYGRNLILSEEIKRINEIISLKTLIYFSFCFIFFLIISSMSCSGTKKKKIMRRVIKQV